MKFKKHKQKIENFFKEHLSFLYNIGYIRKTLEENSRAFSYSFKLLQGMYSLGTTRYKFILAFLYLIGMIWQAYMISDIVPFSEAFYYIGLEYSAVLMMKILTVVILTIALCFMTVWIMYLLPFFIACIIPAILIGNALFEYRHFMPVPITWINLAYVLIICFIYYRSEHARQVKIKAGVILFYIFAGLFYTVLSTDVLQKKTSDIQIELRDNISIDGKLHFFNGTKYFVSYSDDETGEETKEIINSVATISVEYK